MSQPERGGESAPRQAHSHTLGLAAAGVRASARLRYSAYALLILVAASTVVGLVWLWPDYDRVSQIAERASYQTAEVGSAEGEILGIEACETPEVVLPETERNRPVPMLPACQLLSVGLLTGPDRGRVIDTEARGTFASSGLRVGDQVQLTTFPNNDPSQQRETVSGSNVSIRSKNCSSFYPTLLALASLSVVNKRLLDPDRIVSACRLATMTFLFFSGVFSPVHANFLFRPAKYENVDCLYCGGTRPPKSFDSE